MHQRRRRPLRRDLPTEWFEKEDGLQTMIGTLAINNHPHGISLADLRYELGEGEADGSVERAVEEMVALGVLRREGEMVFVTSIPPGLRVASAPPGRNGRRRRPRRRESR
jgi:hypothetical protein